MTIGRHTLAELMSSYHRAGRVTEQVVNSARLAYSARRPTYYNAEE